MTARHTLATVVAASAAVGALAGPVDATTPRAAGWHVFVYVVNDSDSLLPYGQDIDEMIVASRSGVGFTVYLDSSARSGPPLGTSAVPNADDAIVIEIADGVVEVTQRLGEADSGAPDTLAWFLAQGLLTHPAERTALVVWDHGGGWRGVAFDENLSASGSTATSSLDSSDVGAALADGLAGAGREALDLLVFDACLMASVDLLGAVAGHTAHVMASEEVIPGLGLDYTAFEVFASASTTPDEYFAAIASAYESEVGVAQPGAPQDFTLSLFDTGLAGEVDAALAAFAAAAAADVAVNPHPYLDATGRVHRYGTSGDFWFGFVDVGEYAGQLDGVSADVAAARTRLLDAIAAARSGQRNGSPNFDAATGLTVYFPFEPREFEAAFAQLPTAAAWMPFLTAFYDAQAAVVLGTDVGFVAESPSISMVAENVYEVEMPVSANFTGTVELLAATADGAGTLTYFEADDGELSAAGTALALVYPSLTTVSDGTRSVVPFTRYRRRPDGTHGISMFTLRRPDGTSATLSWDRKVDEGPFTLVDGAVVTSYTPQAGDLAFPDQLVRPPGGDLSTAPGATPLDPNRHWTIEDVLLPAGTQVILELRLLDAAGNVIDTATTVLVVGGPERAR